MTCASCVRHVEKALLATQGVTAASVNLATSTATVEGTASFETTARQVEEAGYGLSEIEPETQKGGGEDLSPARRRMVIALALTAPMLATMFPGLHWHLPGWVQLLLATPVVFVAGWGFFRRAARQARHGQASMDTPVSYTHLRAH